MNMVTGRECLKIPLDITGKYRKNYNLLHMQDKYAGLKYG
jgi:hypothetical protein